MAAERELTTHHDQSDLKQPVLTGLLRTHSELTRNQTKFNPESTNKALGINPEPISTHMYFYCVCCKYWTAASGWWGWDEESCDRRGVAGVIAQAQPRVSDSRFSTMVTITAGVVLPHSKY